MILDFFYYFLGSRILVSLLSKAPALPLCFIAVKYSHQNKILVLGNEETWWSMQNHTECRIRKNCVCIVYWTLPYFMESKVIWDCRCYYFSVLRSFMPECQLYSHFLHVCQCCWRVLLQPLNWSNQTLEQRMFTYRQSYAFMSGQSEEFQSVNFLNLLLWVALLPPLSYGP